MSATSQCVVIVGGGPLPCDGDRAVMAPGARTWQIAKTCAAGLMEGPAPRKVVILTLESERRDHGAPRRVSFGAGLEPVDVFVQTLNIDDFKKLALGDDAGGIVLPQNISCVVGTASAQPLATAAGLAERLGVPLWCDFFGDPLCELQSKAQLDADQQQPNSLARHHVWRLIIRALHRGDAFSALSARQRYLLQGQLGWMGRLNRSNAMKDFVHELPFGVFDDDFASLSHDVAAGNERRDRDAEFRIAWCGSFNTWMDVDTLVGGLAQAIRANSAVRLVVLGGQIAGYNESSYPQFLARMQAEGVAHAVRTSGWLPFAEIPNRLAECHIGLSIDRHTAEAQTGSRTRLLQFLCAGLPVLSTTPTELAANLAGEGFVLPFEIGNADSLRDAILQAAERADLQSMGREGAVYVRQRYGGRGLGAPLMAWVQSPTRNADAESKKDNPLRQHWEKFTAVIAADDRRDLGVGESPMR